MTTIPKEIPPDHSREKATLVISSLFVLLIVVIGMFFLSSCQYLPQVADDLKDIETQDAVELTITKEAFGKETDIHATIDVVNKEVSEGANGPQQPF